MLRPLLLPALLAFGLASAKDDPLAVKRKALEDLQREPASLENLKAEKLEALEKKEAERWDARYRAAARAKENDDKARSLEEKYGRLATDLTRVEEELVKAKNEAKDKADEAAAVRSSWDGFNATLKRAVDGAAVLAKLTVCVPDATSWYGVTERKGTFGIVVLGSVAVTLASPGAAFTTRVADSTELSVDPEPSVSIVSSPTLTWLGSPRL